MGLLLLLRRHALPATLPLSSLAAEWRFDDAAGSQTITDSGPNGLHLTNGATGGVETTDLTLDGTHAATDGGDYALLADTALLEPGAGNFTVYWAGQVASFASQCAPISKRGTGAAGANPGWGLRFHTDGTLHIELDDDTTAAIPPSAAVTAAVTTASDVLLGVSFHRAASALGYVNGAASGSDDISAVSGAVGGTQPLYVARFANTNSGFLPSGSRVYWAAVYIGVAHDAATQARVYRYAQALLAARGVTI